MTYLPNPEEFVGKLRAKSVRGADWTNERVERLKLMWGQGWKASDIAADLGGATRNAVIGKAHRIGLARGRQMGRTALSAAQHARIIEMARERQPYRVIAAEIGCAKKTVGTHLKALNWTPARSRTITVASKTRFNKHQLVFHEIEVDESVDAADESITFGQRRTLLELTAKTCRWPVGEPGSSDFFFCGGLSLKGMPYCALHHRRSIDPTKRGSAYAWHR